MWLVYRNVHMQLKGKGMQLKVKDMQLKVSMQKNIGERGSRGDICSLSSSLVFFGDGILLTSSCGLEENRTSHTCYLYQKQKLFSYF